MPFAPLDEDLVAQVRRDVAACAEQLRDAAAEINATHLPALESAVVNDWISLARLTYEATRGTVDFLLRTAAVGCHGVAWQYELALPALDVQQFVAEVL